MRVVACILGMLGGAGVLLAQPSPTINFNLVQVNHYHGQEQRACSVVTPGQRVVIDLQNPLAIQQMAKETGEFTLAPIVATVESHPFSPLAGMAVAWESSVVLRSATAQDSFLVTASRTGCPGTEVRPSVAVAFALGNGWSNPPIRFGPLSERTTCALGEGYQLEVSAVGDDAPVVRLKESAGYGRR